MVVIAVRNPRQIRVPAAPAEQLTNLAAATAGPKMLNTPNVPAALMIHVDGSTTNTAMTTAQKTTTQYSMMRPTAPNAAMAASMAMKNATPKAKPPLAMTTAPMLLAAMAI
jgi:hypothetical protein